MTRRHSWDWSFLAIMLSTIGAGDLCLGGLSSESSMVQPQPWFLPLEISGHHPQKTALATATESLGDKVTSP